MNEVEQAKNSVCVHIIYQLPERHASPLPVAVAVMEVAAQYTDMSGLQKRALVKAVMEEIVRHHVPALAPHLPLVEALRDNMVRASRREFRSAPRAAFLLPAAAALTV